MKKEVIYCQKDLKIISQNKDEIITKAKYGPSKLTRIPLFIDENLAFFVGCIIGDGHLKKDKMQISIELTNRNLIDKIAGICYLLFNRKFNVKAVKLRLGKKQSYNMCIDSKAIYNLLKEVFEIPSGKKKRYSKDSKTYIKFK